MELSAAISLIKLRANSTAAKSSPTCKFGAKSWKGWGSLFFLSRCSSEFDKGSDEFWLMGRGKNDSVSAESRRSREGKLRTCLGVAMDCSIIMNLETWQLDP